MAAEDIEKFLKKKLQSLLAEMLRLGTVKGFSHFAMYQRGREELLLCVVNEPLTTDTSYSHGINRRMSLTGSGSLTSGNLPYDKRSLMLSARTQKNLSGYGDIGVGLPPASPSDTEIAPCDKNSTLFLLAAYGRYNCPYVWVRSNHERLVMMTGDSKQEKDSPLRLRSTSEWKDGHIRLWDIIAELVKLCTYPPPLNPFAVDYDYFDSLPLQERYFATGAMVNFLQRIILASDDDKTYMSKVFEDVQAITELHLRCLQDLANQQQFEFLKQKSHDIPTASGLQQNRQTHSSKTPYWKRGPEQQNPPVYNTYGSNYSY